MKLHDACIFCGDELQEFQRLMGRCNWCMKAMSDEEQNSNALLALDMSYSFTDDATHDDEEDNGQEKRY